jgi:hypothetical protein
MITQRKIRANRANGRKSRGPKTTAGKIASSRNGLRHGLTTINRQNELYANEIKAMAIAICDGDNNPLVYEQALIIAESEVLLRCIQSQSVQPIERLRDPDVRRLSKIKQYMKLLLANSEQNLAAVWRLDAMFAEYNAKVAIAGEENVKPVDYSSWNFSCPMERDEHEALCEAFPDLLHFGRYERRARSRQKRALRTFIAIKARRNNSVPPAPTQLALAL